MKYNEYHIIINTYQYFALYYAHILLYFVIDFGKNTRFLGI